MTIQNHIYKGVVLLKKMTSVHSIWLNSRYVSGKYRGGLLERFHFLHQVCLLFLIKTDCPGRILNFLFSLTYTDWKSLSCPIRIQGHRQESQPGGTTDTLSSLHAHQKPHGYHNSSAATRGTWSIESSRTSPQERVNVPLHLSHPDKGTQWFCCSLHTSGACSEMQGTKVKGEL